MAGSVPPAPAFGETLPVETAPEVVAFLAKRRSASAMSLTAPGPDDAQLADILRIAARVPDHGKLSPWRFIILKGEAKDTFAERIAALADSQANPTKATAALRKLTRPPVCIAVVSRHIPGEIPEWEQRQSASAVCHQLLLAASALGWGANWITDWYSYDPRATAILGLADGEQVAGYLYLGTATEQPQERARPDVASITTAWSPR
ncbi:MULTISPECIES: nitroreductase [unclassified Caulobacter]|uniref:nitroreductase family protein n=1 Tax=unclassified Caulobacter TaxID=2648921 RepID=UPI0007828879|nr:MULTISPECIES: nitroreductase [unclassified Caulobacter]AZS20494.1 nitroreductase [Caulobacter sp. FWC26]